MTCNIQIQSEVLKIQVGKINGFTAKTKINKQFILTTKNLFFSLTNTLYFSLKITMEKNTKKVSSTLYPPKTCTVNILAYFFHSFLNFVELYCAHKFNLFSTKHHNIRNDLYDNNYFLSFTLMTTRSFISVILLCVFNNFT